MAKNTTTPRSFNSQTVHENSALRRENGKLRKQIQRLNSLIQNFFDRSADELLQEKEQQRKEKEKGKRPLLPPSGIHCPKCDEDMQEVDLSRAVLLICPVCKYREKK